MRVVTSIEVIQNRLYVEMDDVNKKRLFDDLYHEVFLLFGYDEDFNVDIFLKGFEDVMAVMKVTGMLEDFCQLKNVQVMYLKAELVEDNVRTYSLKYDQKPRLTEHIVVLGTLLYSYFHHDEIAEFFGLLFHDIIEIISSTEGSPAHGTVGELPEYKRKGNIELSVNGKKIACPRMVKVNGTVALESYEIIENDRIDILDYYTIEEVMEVMDMPAPDYFYINGKEAEIDDRIYDGFSVTCEWENEEEVMNEGEELHSESEHTLQTEDKKVSENIGKELSESKTKAEGQKQSDQGKIAAEEQNRKDIHILVNGTQVTLSGKASYIFVDILDFYPFDTSTAGGSSIIMTVNGLEATFSTPIRDGEQVELYWKE